MMAALFLCNKDKTGNLEKQSKNAKFARHSQVCLTHLDLERNLAEPSMTSDEAKAGTNKCLG